MYMEDLERTSARALRPIQLASPASRTEELVDLWRVYRRLTRLLDPKAIRAVEMQAEGYTYDEIAGVLGRNPRMVSRYLTSVRKSLGRSFGRVAE